MKKLLHMLCTGKFKYITAFCFTVFLAMALLIAGAFLPQWRIQTNVMDSVWIASADIDNNYILDRGAASKLDVGTDLMMLRTSLSTSDRYLGAVLTNPVYFYEGLSEWDDVDETLARLACDMPHDDVWFYARYWMGFRPILRLALTFFNYAQIKRYLALIFFSLFMAATCSVSKNANSKIAFLFGLSVILVRPYVMATSMQFTCCFLIGFLAMLLVPWLYRNPEHEALFFMEVGMITMYFDFYTVPLITVGFPLLYLWILKKQGNVHSPVRAFCRNLFAWFMGYGMMWIAKLVLTTVLTSVNALEQGFGSLASRVGIQKDVQLEQYYSVEAAFKAVREAMFSDKAGAVVYLLCAGIIMAVVIYKLAKKQASLQSFRENWIFLFIAAMPLVWFVITKQPVAIHGYFQYRNIALTHWAAGVFFYFLFSSGKNKALPETNA